MKSSHYHKRIVVCPLYRFVRKRFFYLHFLSKLTSLNPPIVNFTRMATRRVDVAVGISYESDLKKAIQVAMNLMKKHSMVLKDPEPAVVTTELADSSVNLQLRAWTQTEDYWTVKFDLTNGILETFNREEGIEIPYPQLDVHLEQK
uniref:Mechanosensitive ion channel MscS C-terminal domain-containing protein n=1 Tax=Candidatus Methanophagaceae archaeon ANME-1 ERB6 TaxID=2759912 RepID=A0A7G9YX67_9EURY|nr:hypothetical protein MBLPMMNE_00006 [Methanosarcinales archaeon ANME-1 ERB6]